MNKEKGTIFVKKKSYYHLWGFKKRYFILFVYNLVSSIVCYLFPCCPHQSFDVILAARSFRTMWYCCALNSPPKMLVFFILYPALLSLYAHNVATFEFSHSLKHLSKTSYSVRCSRMSLEVSRLSGFRAMPLPLPQCYNYNLFTFETKWLVSSKILMCSLVRHLTPAFIYL